MDINDLISVLRENFLDPKAFQRAHSQIKSTLRRTLRKATSRKVKFKPATGADQQKNAQFIHELSPDAIHSTIHITSRTNSPNPADAVMDITPIHMGKSRLTPNGKHLRQKYGHNLATSDPSHSPFAFSPEADQMKARDSFNFPPPITKHNMSTIRSQEYSGKTPRSILRKDSMKGKDDKHQSTLSKMRSQSSRRILKTFSGFLAREDSAERHDMVMNKPNAFAMDVKRLDTTHRDFEYSDHEESHFHRDATRDGYHDISMMGMDMSQTGVGGHALGMPLGHKKHRGGASMLTSKRGRAGKFGGKRRMMNKQGTRRGAALMAKERTINHVHGMKMRQHFANMLEDISDNEERDHTLHVEHNHVEDTIHDTDELIKNNYLSPEMTAPANVEHEVSVDLSLTDDDADNEFDIDEKLDPLPLVGVNSNQSVISNNTGRNQVEMGQIMNRRHRTVSSTLTVHTRPPSHDYKKPPLIDLPTGSLNENRLYNHNGVGNLHSQLKSRGSLNAISNVPSFASNAVRSPTHSLNQNIYIHNQRKASLTPGQTQTNAKEANNTNNKIAQSYNSHKSTTPMGQPLNVIKSDQELIKLDDNTSNELPDIHANLYNDLEEEDGNNNGQSSDTTQTITRLSKGGYNAMPDTPSTTDKGNQSSFNHVVATTTNTNDTEQKKGEHSPPNDNNSNNSKDKLHPSDSNINKLKLINDDAASDSFIYSVTNKHMLPDLNVSNDPNKKDYVD